MNARAVTALAILALALLACEREERRFREVPPASEPTNAVRVSDLQPGGMMVSDSTYSTYDENAYAISEGKRLFETMNCAGCHFHGGGGIGPPLMDDEWIYGSDPSQIFKTIIEGRPNGMPAFKGKLGNQQVWQIVAYVRSLSGLGSRPATSARDDHMKLTPNAQLQRREKAKKATAGASQ
jgi:cytochrome c oxidase cbb3-type subunit 3